MSGFFLMLTTNISVRNMKTKTEENIFNFEIVSAPITLTDAGRKVELMAS